MVYFFADFFMQRPMALHFAVLGQVAQGVNFLVGFFMGASSLSMPRRFLGDILRLCHKLLAFASPFSLSPRRGGVFGGA
jgi:hypothetical protein